MITDQDRIRPTVIMALELEHQIAAGMRARKSKCGLHGFAAAGSKRDAPGAGHHPLEAFGNLKLQFMLRSV